MTADSWFRNTHWDDSIAQAFEQRLTGVTLRTHTVQHLLETKDYHCGDCDTRFILFPND